MVADGFAAAVGGDGSRLIRHARYYWLLLAESHLAWRLFGSMVRRGPEGTPALPVPAGSGASAKGNQAGRAREETERCLRSLLKMRQFLVFPTRKRQAWPLRGPPESLGMDRIEITAPTKASGSMLVGGREAAEKAKWKSWLNPLMEKHLRALHFWERNHLMIPSPESRHASGADRVYTVIAGR